MPIKTLSRKLALLVFLLCPGANSAAEKTTDSYVGANQCASCHKQAYSDWRLSDHSKSMAVANAETILGNFDNSSAIFHNMKSRFYKSGSKYFIETIGSDNKTHEYLISYTFGHFPLQQYLVEIENGHIQALNVAWDSRTTEEGGQRWIHLQPSEDITPDSPFFWTRHLQNWNSRCAQCHSTNLQKNYNVDDNSFGTTWSEINVACEACHGPGAEHLRLAKAGELDKVSGLINLTSNLSWEFAENQPIAQPVGKKSNNYLNMCGGCHSRRSIIADLKPGANYHNQYRLSLLDENLYHPDGQIQDEVFVLGSFLQSKMHAKGVTCMNCHQPHSGKLLLQGNNLCAQCHQPKTYDSANHHFHKHDSAGAQCVECHMPENRYMLVDDRRDHRFGIPNPALSLKLGTPNACNQCHKGTTANWAANALDDWKPTSQPPEAWALVNAAARLGDPTMTRPILSVAADESNQPIIKATLLQQLAVFPSRVGAEAAEKYLAHPEPLIRAAAVRSLDSAPTQIRWQQLSPLITDPVKSVRMEVAISLSNMLTEIPLEKIGEFRELIVEYRGSLAQSIDMPAAQASLGNLELNLGNPTAAENAYEKALTIEPLYIPALLNLADLYRATNNEAKASPLLLRALEFAPDSGATNFSYGLSLVRQQKYQAALPYLKAATEQQDSQVRYAYVYAVALDSVALTDKALVFLEKANEKWPNQYDLLLTQILYMEKLNLTDDILRPLSRLSKIAPGSPAVRQRVQKYVEAPGSE